MLFNPSNFLLGFYWVPVFHFDTGTPDYQTGLSNRRQDCHLRIINVCQTTKWFYEHDQSQHHHVSSFELICLKRWTEKYPRNPYIFLSTSSADTLMSWSLRAATIRLMALFRLYLSMYFECFTLKRPSSWLPKFIKTRVLSCPHYFALHRFLLLFWFKSFFMGTSCDNICLFLAKLLLMYLAKQFLVNIVLQTPLFVYLRSLPLFSTFALLPVLC